MSSRFEEDMRRQAGMDPVEASVRRSTRQQLVESGIPEKFVDEIVDLGFHAAQRALDALHDVIFSAADNRVTITALGVALGLAKARFEGQERAMLEVASVAGLRSKSLMVGGARG